MMTVKKMMPDYMKCVLIGALLGTISKYLDTVAVDGSWLADVFHYCSHILSRLGIWVLIAAMIARVQ